jgi:DNA polymerase-3 subunit alpha
MAAVMNCDIHLTDKLGAYKQEIDRLGIEVVPPCVNRSEATFGVADGRVVYALGALKNVGVEAMRLITEARAAGGRYTGLFDFAARVDLRRVGKRAVEMLARSGALDALDSNRRKVFESLEALIACSAAAHDERASAQVSLFGEAADALPAPRLPSPDDWAPIDRLAQEQAAIGFYLSGHPLDDYAPALRREKVVPHAELLRLAAAGPTVARVAGTIAAVDQRKSARGTRFAFVRLSDPTGLYEVRLFSDVLEAARDHLEPGRSVVLTVEATVEGDELRLLARHVQSVDAAVAGAASAGLRIYLDDAAAAAPSLAARLDQIRREPGNRKRGPIELVVMAPDLPGETVLALPDSYPLGPSVGAALKSAPGVAFLEEF